METESIGSSVGSFSSVATAPSISSGSNFGSEIGSSFSFADTISYSPSLDISGLDGGSFDPNFSFRDCLNYDFVSSDFAVTPENNIEIPEVFKTGLADINLDPDKPDYQIPEIFRVGLEDINLDPDLPDYKVPEIFETGLTELNLDPDIEDSKIPQIFVDAFRDEDLLTPPPFSESINVLDVVDIQAQTNNIEHIIYSNEPEMGKIEAKEELTGYSLQVTVEEIVEDMPEIALPEMQQSIQTYNALINAGIQTAEAGILVEQALIQAGTEPKIAQKVMEQVKIATQNLKVEKNDEEEDVEEEEEEEKEKKKKRLKFVVDEKALGIRLNALDFAIQEAPIRVIKGKEVKDPREIVACMPMDEENQDIKSSILEKTMLILFDFDYRKGDGSYRKSLNLFSQQSPDSEKDIKKQAQEMIKNCPPVALVEEETGGRDATEKDAIQVRRHEADPVSLLRRMVIYNN